LDQLPIWLLPTLGVVLPLVVQYAPEAWRVPIVGAASGLIAIVFGWISPLILAAQVPQLAWDLFTRLAAGYTAAKVGTSMLGSQAVRKAAGTVAIAALLSASIFLAWNAHAQDGLAAPQGDDGWRDFAVVIVTGAVARLMSWVAKKIKGKKHSESLLT